jgi:hypothetical protein
MSLSPAHSKPPLTPKQAIVISLCVALGGIPAVLAAHVFLYEALGTAGLYYALALFLTLAVSWSFLDWQTRDLAIRGNNAFVMFAVALIIVVAVVQKEHEPFPGWAIASLIVAGVAGYSVAGICGIRNFIRWRRGEFAE